MPTKKELVTSEAIMLLKASPVGLKYSELLKKIQSAFPEILNSTIQGYLWNLELQVPSEVYKPARGLYRLVMFKEGGAEAPAATATAKVGEHKEEAFYKPFADWLQAEIEECTRAIPLGGSTFKDKWGTPDVIGVRKPRTSDILKPPAEVVAAEIKSDPGNLIAAFGQACAYTLFSHRSYVVIPRDSNPEDIDRLDVLCMTLGIGLILFDRLHPEAPEFAIRVRAARHEPDMFYLNKYAKHLEEQLFS